MKETTKSSTTGINFFFLINRLITYRNDIQEKDKYRLIIKYLSTESLYQRRRNVGF